MERPDDPLFKQKVDDKRRYFDELQASLPSLRQQLRAEAARVEELRAELAVQMPRTPALIQQLFDAEQAVAHLDKEVNSITGREEETEFWLDFGMLMQEQRRPAPVAELHNPSPVLLAYDDGSDSEEYEAWHEEEEDEEEVVAVGPDEPPRRTVRVSSFIDKEETRNSYAAQQVINLIDGKGLPTNVMHVMSQQQCSDCGGDLALQREQYQCLRCGTVHHLNGELVTNDSQSNFSRSIADRERTNYVQQYTYKKINHFKDWLSQFQAKESTVIAEDILDKVRVALLQKKCKNFSKITPKQIHRILKDVCLPKMYEHRNLICNKISGNPPPFLTREQEQKLRDMFEALQEPFEQCKPKGRKNFLSYSYVLHQLLRIAGHPPRIYRQFKLLSCRARISVHDSCWCRMVALLDQKRALGMRWPFYPSC